MCFKTIFKKIQILASNKTSPYWQTWLQWAVFPFPTKMKIIMKLLMGEQKEN